MQLKWTTKMKISCNTQRMARTMVMVTSTLIWYSLRMACWRALMLRAMWFVRVYSRLKVMILLVNGKLVIWRPTISFGRMKSTLEVIFLAPMRLFTLQMIRWRSFILMVDLREHGVKHPSGTSRRSNLFTSIYNYSVLQHNRCRAFFCK